MNLIAMAAKFKGWIATAFLFLVGVGLAYLSGKKDEKHSNEIEKKDAEIEQTNAVSKAEITAAKDAKKVVEHVNRSSSDDVDDELQRFTRD
ncbi:Rz-like spanin [Pantoea phage vB_PagM_SSEM1]|uniref:I-spanin n=1 Tax=Pantoea phage vB_PagM_SSEM1 TaxID=2721760 RepID=A0A6H0D9T5_9CAUD|nr:Rz-like spanin [Pantoea phage vB_PagM_SSEM1]QIS79350.1 hypothetical protein SSEM1_gp44 [Pantoea phage vB_PagM_SSEM1]